MNGKTPHNHVFSLAAKGTYKWGRKVSLQSENPDKLIAECEKVAEENK